MFTKFHSCGFSFNFSYFFISVVLIFFIICVVLAKPIPFRLNLSPSMPIGIYHVIHKEIIQRGNFVEVCLPKALAKFAVERGYLHKGACSSGVEPLLKQVVGIAGDEILITQKNILINHHALFHSARELLDSHHRSLPAIPLGIYFLHKNQLWLFGLASAHSWDSRYFGPVDTSHVVAIVKPWLTFTWEK